MNRDKVIFFFSLFLLGFAFTAVYIGKAFNNHENFFTNFDLAIFDQTLRAFSHFHLPASNLWGIPVIFGDHFYPIIVLLAPVYRLWPDPRMLLILQPLLLVSALIPLYYLAEHVRLKRWETLAMAVLYLSFPGLQNHVIPGGDFHEMAFAPVLFFSLIYFLVKKNWLWYSFFLALLFLTKENIIIYLGFFSILIFVYYKERTVAIWTWLASLSMFLLIIFLLMPIFSGGPYFYFQVFNGSESFEWPRLLSPFIYSLPFFGGLVMMPLFMVFYFPLYLEKGLSEFSVNHFYTFQHTIFFGLAGIIVLLHFFQKYANRPLISRLAIVWALCAALVISWNFGLPLVKNSYWFARADLVGRQELLDLLADIPPQASVAAHHILLPRLTSHEFLYPLPKIKHAEYVIDVVPDVHGFTQDWTVRVSETLKNEPAFRLVKENAKGRVFQRIGPYTLLLQKKLDDLCNSAVEDLKQYTIQKVHSKVMSQICQTN